MNRKLKNMKNREKKIREKKDDSGKTIELKDDEYTVE